MSLITVNFKSIVLKRTVTVQATVPADKNNGLAYIFDADRKFPTLYLLHGLMGNYTDWTVSTQVQKYADDHNLALVMPSGDNSFYADLPQVNSDYGRFIGEELVDFTRRLFPLSPRREDTFIGGLSMGGFGALRNGFRYADIFGYVISLSAAIHVFEQKPGDPARGMLCNEDFVFGPWEEAAKTDNNPAVALANLADRVKNGQSSFPTVYMACGTEDSLLVPNRSFRDKLKATGVKLTYIEEHGQHEWGFWDRHIKYAIENWLLPLGEKQEGTSSGHVTME